MSNDSCAISWEEREWTRPPDELGALSRRARMQARGPYQAAIPAQIADLTVQLPAELMTDVEDAVAEIVRFDAEITRGLPGFTGDIGPLDAVLLRTESASSSQIEHITAGAKALALATLGERTRPNAAMVAANVAAMRAATALAEQMSESALLDAHRTLMAGQEAAQPGRYRDAQVWIGAAAPTPHTAQFVPPHPDHVPAAMADLYTYLSRSDVPALIQASVAHAQFETIHPFADGNGRTGRVLVHAVLRRTGVIQRISVPVSAGLLRDTASYFDALTAYRDGDPAPIVRQFAAATFDAVHNGRQLVDDLGEMVERWRTQLKARRDAAAWRALGQVVAQPATTVDHLARSLKVSRPAAQRAIDQLVTANILQPATAQKRNRVWLATEAIEALDEFAARAGRRH